MAVLVALPSTVTPLGGAVTATLPIETYSPICADLIDPATGDFASMTSGLDPVDAQVVIALNTVRGSGACVVEDGNDLASIRKIRDTVRREIESEVRVAFKRLLDAGDIRLESFAFEVRKGDQYVGVTIEYTNLRARGRRAVTLVITN
jgi:hypothetical protein